MRGIELASFGGRMERIGAVYSADSVVGLIEGSNQVIKWSRINFETAKEAFSSAQHVQKSVSLYQELLGQDFVVPTQVLVGQKKDGNIMPNEVERHPYVQHQWSTLYERLSTLYKFSSKLKRESNSTNEAVLIFPVNMTLGNSREAALGGELACGIPKSPNLIVERGTLQIKPFDWGSYDRWSDSMSDSYKQINQLSGKKIK